MAPFVSRLVCACVVVLALVAGISDAAPLFIFGDSMLDVGNNNYFTQGDSHANFYPYGISRFPESGRFTNGYNFGDLIAVYMKIPIPAPYEKYIREGGSTSLGLNFASGGAGILDATHFNETYPISAQLKFFRGLISSGDITPETISKAIFLVNIGGNDLFLAPTDASEIPTYLTSLVLGYIQFIKDLYQAGARKFILSAVPPVGCVPIIRLAFGGSPPLGCNANANDVAFALNSAIKANLYDRAFIFTTSKAELVYYDQFAGLIDTITNKEEHYFNTTDACCAGPGPYAALVSCGHSAVIDGKVVNFTLCSDIRQHIFWDWFHPTARAHGIVASGIWFGSSFTIPSKGAGKLWFPKMDIALTAEATTLDLKA